MQLFLRGIVLPFQKGKSLMRGIQELSAPASVRVPVGHTDAPSPISHLPEDAALAAGQVLCEMDGIPAISPISGTLEGTVVTHHPLYGELLCADIQPEGEREDRLPVVPEEGLTPKKIREIAREAAIYDELDGVPLWEKLEKWEFPEGESTKDCLLVADATENDIFGSSAWAVLMEQPRLCLFGLQMAASSLRFTRYHIATMLPKRRRRTLKRAIGRENVYTVGDEYPVTVYTDEDDVQVFRIGIQACLALGRALKQGLRHTAAIVTVAGDGVPAARNLRVPFGTELSALLVAAQAQSMVQVIMGDAMNGIVCDDLHIPLLPGVTTVLVMKPRKIRTPKPCFGCGRCAAVCHAGLLPYEIVRRAENMHYERLMHLSPGECDGCAACSYVCPAGRDVAADVLAAGETKGTLFLNWGGRRQ